MKQQHDSFPVCIIEGNIGAGKSTFLKMVSTYLNAQLVYEPHEQWQNIAGHNLLDYFYKDMQRWAYTFQSYAFITRIKTQWELSKINQHPVQIIERSVYTDRYCFARNCYDMGFMTEVEWQLYQQWFSWLLETMPKPDAFIYLRTEPEVCYQRIQKRNRSEEGALEYSYIKLLHDRHEEWLIHKKHVDRSLINIPVLILECSEEFEHNHSIQKAQIAKITAFLEHNFGLSSEKVCRSLSQV